jgi:hypothetical protein
MKKPGPASSAEPGLWWIRVYGSFLSLFFPLIGSGLAGAWDGGSLD